MRSWMRGLMGEAMNRSTFKQWLVNYGIPAFNLYKENIKQELTPQEQLNKDGAELLKAYAEIKRIRVTCIINDGINTPPAQEKNNG